MNVAKLNELIAAVHLEGVRLVSSKVASTVRDASDAGEVSLRVLRSAKVESPPRDGVFFVLATLHAKLESKAADKPAVSVLATFELAYEIPEVFSVSDENLQAFAETNGIFNVWPYWREYLQATLQRMALPPIVLPLLTMKQIVGGLAAETPSAKRLPEKAKAAG